MSMFGSSGNLILPSGALEAYERYKMELPGGRKTRIFVMCPRCGHKWERLSGSEKARCRRCQKKFSLEDLK